MVSDSVNIFKFVWFADHPALGWVRQFSYGINLFLSVHARLFSKFSITKLQLQFHAGIIERSVLENYWKLHPNLRWILFWAMRSVDLTRVNGSTIHFCATSIKIWKISAFFTFSPLHLSEPLKKHKNSALWFVIGGFRSVLCVSEFKFRCLILKSTKVLP